MAADPKKGRERDVPEERPAIPLPRNPSDRSGPLTPIQQAAYSAAIFGPSSPDSEPPSNAGSSPCESP